MRLLKTNVILRLLNSYIVDSPQPANISYLWNFGSLLGTCLVIQILTGVFLAMHYQPHVDFAFNSVEHIMRDVNAGWILRYTHANVASFFFIFVYAHIARGLYYSSYKSPRILVWSIGVIILILMMAIAFLGYVNSPKWINGNIFYAIFLIIGHYNIQILIRKIKARNSIKNTKYNKLNNKLTYSLNSFNIRSYSTNASSNKGNELFCSKRLISIITELRLSPVYIFENLELENIRKQILNETKGLSGIYMIVNKITKDYYIGSAATNRFYGRFSNHLIYFRGSKIVKLAVKKYGLSNFAFIILDLYPNIVTKENNKELLNLEDRYLKLLLPNYNILTEAGSSFGYKHTEVNRQKIKDGFNDIWREMIGNLNWGKKFSLETIDKMRQKALNKPPMSDKTKNNTRSVILYNLNGTVYGEYSTILDAAKSINCDEKTIRRALNTEKGLVKRQWVVKDLSKTNNRKYLKNKKTVI
jgi:group I intron endonuclease